MWDFEVLSHLTSTFAFFFDLFCPIMQSLTQSSVAIEPILDFGRKRKGRRYVWTRLWNIYPSPTNRSVRIFSVNKLKCDRTKTLSPDNTDILSANRRFRTVRMIRVVRHYLHVCNNFMWNTCVSFNVSSVTVGHRSAYAINMPNNYTVIIMLA